MLVFFIPYPVKALGLSIVAPAERRVAFDVAARLVDVDDSSHKMDPSRRGVIFSVIGIPSLERIGKGQGLPLAGDNCPDVRDVIREAHIGSRQKVRVSDFWYQLDSYAAVRYPAARTADISDCVIHVDSAALGIADQRNRLPQYEAGPMSGNEFFFGQFESFRAISDGGPSASPEQCSEYPKQRGHQDQEPRKPSYPPVWIRVPVALILGLGSGGVVILGIIVADDKGRPVFGGSLVVIAFMMFLCGGALMLALGIPATWGWWV